MAGITRRKWLASASVIGLVVGVPPLTGVLEASAPRVRRKRSYKSIPPRELMRRRHFPNVELITHHGKKVRFYDDLIKGKKVMFNFMYAECDNVCPPITANLVRVQRLLGDRVGRDLFMYSITLKPEEDSPADLKRYAQMHKAQPGWLFLTGKPADIERLRRALGYVYPDPAEDADKSNHIGMLRFGDEAAVRWAGCPGQAAADWIASSILQETLGAQEAHKVRMLAGKEAALAGN